MNEVVIQVGDILQIDKSIYRIIYISSPSIVLCQMNTPKMNIGEHDLQAIRTGVLNEDIRVIKDVETAVVDTEMLSEAEKRAFELRKNIVKDINAAYAPSYLSLNGRLHRQEIDDILIKYNLTRPRFWRICRTYLQSGMKESSLLRKKRAKTGDAATGKKRGSKGDLGIAAGCPLTPEVIEAFEYGLNFYKSGRSKSFEAAYDTMNNRYFFHDVVVGGKVQSRLLPIDERPTFRQFYYYCHKNLPREEYDAIKTSRMEQRNNKRLLLSEDVANVEAPGEKVEADSLEVDLSLISLINDVTKQTIGRPIVYCMRDALTHAVVAVSVSLENNSFLGYTNLFLNLGEDKKEFFAKYDIELPDERLFPSNFLPLDFYSDKGSDYKSDPAEILCNALGINRHTVPGGSGSMKGMIEQWFHQIHSMINPYTESAGQIQKRHDSQHHKQAVLNVHEFTKMLLICILSYNQSHMDKYKPRACEIRDGIDSTPSVLWEYYCRTKGAPRPITDRADYLYKLLVPKQAKIDKRGIHFKGLTYINYDDEHLLGQMYRAQNKKYALSVRYDPRDNSRLYYTDSVGNMVYAELNEGLGWQRDLKGLTFKETSDYFKMVSVKNKEARQRNEEIKAMRAGLVEDIVENAKANSPRYAETKNMREEREREKQLLNRMNAITDRIAKEEGKAIGESSDSTKIIDIGLPGPSEATEPRQELTEKEYLDMVGNFYDYEGEYEEEDS